MFRHNQNHRLKRKIMKKQVSIILIGFILFQSCNVPVQKLGDVEYGRVMFEFNNLDKVLIASKEQNKPIFVDVYTSWCGWCRRLDNETYTNPTVIRYINKNFIPIKMDAEHGQGRTLVSKYGIHAYPRMLFLDSTGKVLNSITGFKDAPKLLQAAYKAMVVYIKPNNTSR